jgi:hypothetical protein
MKQKTITTPPFKLNGRSLRRYQKGNQNPFIEEEQTTQWPKEKVQKDKQRSTKHTHKTKYRVTRTMNSTKTRGELRCYGRVSSSCSTSGTRRVNLVINPVMNEEKTETCLRHMNDIVCINKLKMVGK